MNRLSLQELRNLLFKKGRLLYGAVFLFCLVCMYGITTEQWQRVNELSEVSSNETVKTSSSGQPRDSSPSVTPSKESTVNLAEGTKKSLPVVPLIGLSKALRGQPFDDPFMHTLGTTKTVTSSDIAISAKNNNEISGETYEVYDGGAQIGPNEIRHTNGQGRLNKGKTLSYRQPENGYIAKGGAKVSHLDSVCLMGIIEGTKDLVMLRIGNMEAAYAVGEGTQGITVKTITNKAVLISDGSKSRWLYIQ